MLNMRPLLLHPSIPILILNFLEIPTLIRFYESLIWWDRVITVQIQSLMDLSKKKKKNSLICPSWPKLRSDPTSHVLSPKKIKTHWYVPHGQKEKNLIYMSLTAKTMVQIQSLMFLWKKKKESPGYLPIKKIMDTLTTRISQSLQNCHVRVSLPRPNSNHLWPITI